MPEQAAIADVSGLAPVVSAAPGLLPSYAVQLRADPELLHLAEEASTVLADLVRSADRPVLGEWDRARTSRGEPLLVLRLLDKGELPAGTEAPGAVTGVFEPDDLRDSLRRTIRLGQLWSDSLRARSDAIWKGYGPLLSDAPAPLSGVE